MKKISIAALLFMIGATLYGHNTDEKVKYEFDSDISNKNEKMQDKLSLFKEGLATQKDIDLYKSSDQNSSQLFSYDVMFIREDGKKVTQNTQNEDSAQGWFSWFDATDANQTTSSNWFSWFDSDAPEINEEKIQEDNSDGWFSWFTSDSSDESTPIQEDTQEESSSWFSWFSDDSETEGEK